MTKHIITATLATAMLPWLTSAQGQQLVNPTPGAGLTLSEFVLMLLDIVQLISTPILVVCLIYGGYLLVTANGNEEQVAKSKQWILWSIVGAAIILGAKVIADVVFNTASLFY